MFIVLQDGRFSVSNEPQGAVAQLLAPVCIEQGRQTELPLHSCQGNTYTYGDAQNLVELTVRQENAQLFYIHRKWFNTAPTVRRFQTSLRVQDCFQASRYLIPCVSINGNDFGNGGEPKGLYRDGRKWVFAYDRVCIPSCTLTENADIACALFASGESSASLESSCSITENEGVLCKEIIHPVVEAPLSYCSRDRYDSCYETYLELAPDGCFESGFYICVSRPRWENYGICDTLDQVLDLYGTPDYKNLPDEQTAWDASLAFARSLIKDCDGMQGFNIGFTPNDSGGFSFRGDKSFEMGWCGQNILLCRMLLCSYQRSGNARDLQTALDILDAWVSTCCAPSGLMATNLACWNDLENATADTCNLGYGAYELLRCHELLEKMDIRRPQYLQAALGICDFFCRSYSPEHGFGKQWSLSGECLDPHGSIGAFVICALVKAYALTGRQTYLQMAEKAIDHYAAAALDPFCFTAGALDTSCVDKETAAPFLISAILLYEQTKKPHYLTYARKAAYYFVSWMFCYDPVYGAQTDAAAHEFRATGLTAVSAQHHHLDAYAGLVVPYIRRLAAYTHDPLWDRRADLMWQAVLQCVSDGTLRIHGRLRPAGSQNEAFFQCRWGEFGVGERGKLNDWLVAWPCAFRLSALQEAYEMKRSDP